MENRKVIEIKHAAEELKTRRAWDNSAALALSVFDKEYDKTARKNGNRARKKAAENAAQMQRAKAAEKRARAEFRRSRFLSCLGLAACIVSAAVVILQGVL